MRTTRTRSWRDRLSHGGWPTRRCSRHRSITWTSTVSTSTTSAYRATRAATSASPRCSTTLGAILPAETTMAFTMSSWPAAVTCIRGCGRATARHSSILLLWEAARTTRCRCWARRRRSCAMTSSGSTIRASSFAGRRRIGTRITRPSAWLSCAATASCRWMPVTRAGRSLPNHFCGRVSSSSSTRLPTRAQSLWRSWTRKADR